MTARIGAQALLVVLLAALAACDKAPPNRPASAGTSAGTSQSSAAGKPATATAEEVAKESRGKVRCPAKISTPARASNAPVDDVVGVRPGMTFEEAANVVMCTHDLMVVAADSSRRFNIQTYGQTIRQGFSARLAEPRVQKTSRQIMKEMQDETFARSGNAVRQDMKPGQSKWYVSTMGVPGEERVIAAAREEWYDEGRNPTMDSVAQALSKKYGAPTHNQDYGNSRVLTWAYDPLGRRLSETSPLYHQCRGTADPDGGTNFSPDCGVVVMATVGAMKENPGLTQYLQVGVMDQASGYEAITGTERALQQLDAQRKAKELEAAGKNADVPQL